MLNDNSHITTGLKCIACAYMPIQTGSDLCEYCNDDALLIREKLTKKIQDYENSFRVMFSRTDDIVFDDDLDIEVDDGPDNINSFDIDVSEFISQDDGLHRANSLAKSIDIKNTDSNTIDNEINVAIAKLTEIQNKKFHLLHKAGMVLTASEKEDLKKFMDLITTRE